MSKWDTAAPKYPLSVTKYGLFATKYGLPDQKWDVPAPKYGLSAGFYARPVPNLETVAEKWKREGRISGIATQKFSHRLARAEAPFRTRVITPATKTVIDSFHQ